MTGIVSLITSRLDNIDFSNPLTFVDLTLAATIIVFVLIYLRKFPVFRVVMGVVMLLTASLIFFLLGLVYTALLFGIVSNLILISLPLIFAPEVRHYLEKLGRFPFLKIPKITERQKREDFINKVVSTVYEMSERKMGGTIVFQRQTGLGETIETGILLDARFSSELLRTIFFPKTALHDGAVIMKGDRVFAAGCLLPISGEVKLGAPFGTRHRSGLTLTRDTDAVVIIISEQRGEVSLAENGRLDIDIDRTVLTQKLLKLL
jgi:diadenylate cyclase